MEKIGVIDIGSNSIRLVLAQIIDRKFFRILDEVKVSARLGSGIEKDGMLEEERMDESYNALKAFKDLCQIGRVDRIIAVGTAALRIAKNRDVFLKRVKDGLQIEIEVISGNHEAYYDFWGVINSLDIDEGLMVDIGGASTEIVHFKNRLLENCISLPFGSITLAQKFDIKEKMSDETQKKLSSFIRKQFQKVSWLKDIKKIPLIGVGGTARNIGKVAMAKSNYPLKIIHNFKLDPKDSFEIYESMKSKTLSQRKKTPGLSKDRADIFMGSFSTINELIDYCSCSRFIISGCGVREGIIYNYLDENRDIINDVLDYSLENAIHKFQLDKAHSHHVFKLTSLMYDRLKSVHGLMEKNTDIIKASSYLHDSGIVISYYHHHKHSFYTILNSGLHGLEHKEILLCAMIASMHRKNKDVENKTHYKSLLSEKDIYTIDVIGMFLRLAESFSKSLTNRIENISFEISETEVTMNLLSRSNIDLELNSASSTLSSFQKLFSKNLILKHKKI